MKFFLDSAIVSEIEHALTMWDFDGVTTNPRHVQVSGKAFMTAIKEIAALFAGTEGKTVSVEVNPHFDNHEDMVTEGLKLAEISEKPTTFTAEVTETGEFVWWFPPGADQYVLPISGGVVVETSRGDLMEWFRDGSPWSLLELPALGSRFGNRMLVVIVPWPHYSELMIEQNRFGIRFSFPTGRHNAAPCEVVALLTKSDPLQVAKVFRDWRKNTSTAQQTNSSTT